jgi:hypothetical protein
MNGKGRGEGFSEIKFSVKALLRVNVPRFYPFVTKEERKQIITHYK